MWRSPELDWMPEAGRGRNKLIFIRLWILSPKAGGFVFTVPPLNLINLQSLLRLIGLKKRVFYAI